MAVYEAYEAMGELPSGPALEWTAAVLAAPLILREKQQTQQQP